MEIWVFSIIITFVVIAQFLMVNFILERMKESLEIMSNFVDIAYDVLEIVVEKETDSEKILLNENNVDNDEK